MDQVRETLRYYHYAYSTEKTYFQWILRYIHHFGGKTHPRQLNERHIERFLSHLAMHDNVSASTQRQALNALVFLYRDVLLIQLDRKIAHIRSKRKPNIPTVLTKDETLRLLGRMNGVHALMAKLLYGGGLRLMECIRLRIKDVDFGNRNIIIRKGKGNKDRSTILPKNIFHELQSHITHTLALHHSDLEQGYGEVYLPDALARKYPNASRETGWQYVFPAKKRSKDPRTGKIMRHHVLQSGLQKAVKRAAVKSNIHKKVSCHTLRHSFATHMLENGVNIRVLQKLLGHADVKTTEIYTHVMKRDLTELDSPLDILYAETAP